MNRPYVICHILSSLDGKNNGPFMAADATRTLGGEYGKIRTEMNADVWLYGTTTVKEFLNFRKPVLEETSGGANLFTQIPGINEGGPVEFALKAVERIGDSGLYLNYLAKNAKQDI